ncbi:MAG: hypothetical protein KDB69_07915, partial [Acidimicrobiia bacterium]|nr:hypothetical protein [Acidimicrobiia bacterium]
MSSLSAIWLVAQREIKERGRSRPYILTSIITILLVLAAIILPGLLGGGTSMYDIGSVGDGNSEIVTTAVQLANANDEPGDPASVEMNVVVFDTRDEAEKALTDGDVDVVLVDGSELVVEREGGAFSSDGPTGLLQKAAGAIALQQILAESGETAQEVVEIMSSDPLETTALEPASENNDQNSIVAYFGLLLLYMAIILYGTWIL